MEIGKVSYEDFQRFHKTLEEGTTDTFSIELSSRLGDDYLQYNPDTEDEWIEENAVTGIQVDGEWVGLLDVCENSKLKNGEPAILLNFILIHPAHQKKGYGRQAVQLLMEQSPHSVMEVLYPCTRESARLFYGMGFGTDDRCNRSENVLAMKKENKQLKGVS